MIFFALAEPQALHPLAASPQKQSSRAEKDYSAPRRHDAAQELFFFLFAPRRRA